MNGTQPSFQPRVLQEEEDRESGIGSTLDLSGSFENDNRRTNHRSNMLPHWEAGGHPEGKGTGVATRVMHHHLPFKENGQSAQDRSARSLDKDRTRRHTRGQSCCVFNSPAVTQQCLAADGSKLHIGWLSSLRVMLLSGAVSHPEHGNHGKR